MLGHSKPWLYLSTYFERYKDEYYDNLFRISTHGDWTKWVEFCLHGTIQRANNAIRTCRKINELREEYHSITSDNPSPRTHQIVEQLFNSPLVTIPSVAKHCSTSYHTARSDINRLIELGILFELTDSRPKNFFAKKLFNVAYVSSDF